MCFYSSPPPCCPPLSSLPLPSVKVDGCGDSAYKAMGAALEATGRPIEYSCSWPAYIGSNETTKPFSTFIADGCNSWRNWDDIQ